MTHVSYSINEDCLNFEDSFGEICVWCNCCGRVNEDTKYEAQLNHYKGLLQEQYEFDGWIEGLEETQKENIESNIEYFKEQIKMVENLIANK